MTEEKPEKVFVAQMHSLRHHSSHHQKWCMRLLPLGAAHDRWCNNAWCTLLFGVPLCQYIQYFYMFGIMAFDLRSRARKREWPTVAKCSTSVDGRDFLLSINKTQQWKRDGCGLLLVWRRRPSRRPDNAGAMVGWHAVHIHSPTVPIVGLHFLHFQFGSVCLCAHGTIWWLSRIGRKIQSQPKRRFGFFLFMIFFDFMQSAAAHTVFLLNERIFIYFYCFRFVLRVLPLFYNDFFLSFFLSLSIQWRWRESGNSPCTMLQIWLWPVIKK